MTDCPKVSVIVANFNGERYLEQAVRSALVSTLRSLEVIIADDVSSDNSEQIVRRLAAEDPRVHWHSAEKNGGPGAARNRAIEHARGEWLAVLDNDDLIAPDRLRRLIAFAEAKGADMVSDDLLVFADDDLAPPQRFLVQPECDAAFQVTPEVYLSQTVMYGRKPNLGFLKPILRRDVLNAHVIRYRESLRIGEDDDLVLMCLAAGMRYWVDPELGYFYRKRGGSISHRLGAAERAAMIEAEALVEQRFAGASPGVARAFRRRSRSIDSANRYHRFIEALSQGGVVGALPGLLSNAGAFGLLRHPVYARAKRLRARLRPDRRMRRDGRRHILFLSRQRVLGRSNGSSVYLLDIAERMRAAGMVPHLLQPSPSVTGRMPFMKLAPELGVFETHLIRGVLRLGRHVVSTSPKVWGTAILAVGGRFLRRLGLPAPAEQAFPHTISIPWNDEDRLFVATHGPARADAVVADYIFQTEAIPFVLRPDAKSAVLVHDLYTLRAESFAQMKSGGVAGSADSIAGVSRDAEAAMLGAAHAAIAIQQTEAEWISANVPGSNVILAPMAAYPVAAAQPGDDRTVLFVASNAPPNVTGLRWFFDSVWPALRKTSPEAELLIAGRVAESFSSAPAGATFLGLVPDLADLYARAGVVISPLTVGSGLKIKLIEALAHGKAIVATTTTLQGVEALVANAVRVADDAEAFAASTADLLGDSLARAQLAKAALETAREHFSSTSCYGGVVSWAAGSNMPI